MTIPAEIMPALRGLLYRKCGAKNSFGPMSFGSGPGMKVKAGKPTIEIGRLEKSGLDLSLLIRMELPYHTVELGEFIEFQLEDDAALEFAQLCLDHNLIPIWKRHFAAEMLYDYDAL